MTTFIVTKEEFDKEAKIFFDALNSLNHDQIDNGLKALYLLYLGIKNATEEELLECVKIIDLAENKVLEKRLDFLYN